MQVAMLYMLFLFIVVGITIIFLLKRSEKPI
jgi:hypothetical protein